MSEPVGIHIEIIPEGHRAAWKGNLDAVNAYYKAGEVWGVYVTRRGLKSVVRSLAFRTRANVVDLWLGQPNDGKLIIIIELSDVTMSPNGMKEALTQWVEERGMKAQIRGTKLGTYIIEVTGLIEGVLI